MSDRIKSRMPIVILVSASIAGGCAAALVDEHDRPNHHEHSIGHRLHLTTIAVSPAPRSTSS